MDTIVTTERKLPNFLNPFINPKPKKNPELRQKLQTQLKIHSNFFLMRINKTVENVYIYSIAFTPEIPHDSFIRKSLFEKIHVLLKERYNFYVYSGDCFFTVKLEEKQEFTSFYKLNNVDMYVKIAITPTKNVVNLSDCIKNQNYNAEIKSLLEIVVKSILKSNELMRIGNSGYYFKNLSSDMNQISKITYSKI